VSFASEAKIGAERLETLAGFRRPAVDIASPAIL
jgi:hypothetical protein